MAKGFKHGAGGSNPLNFKVVGNPQPQNPKENTIWIDTDTEITNWVFSATEHDAMRSGINRIVRPYYTSNVTKYGVTFTVNDDGTITANGTNDGNALSQFAINRITLPAGTYYLSGCQDGDKTELMVHTGSASLGRGKNVLFTLSDEQRIDIYYQINKNDSVTNAVCNPVLCRLDGMVWITTGISSNVTFNALKKNGIQVYPTSAKQHISGAWVDKNAKSYQGGKWADWMYVILGDGGTVIGDFNTISSGYGGSASLSGNTLTLSVKEGFSDKGASILALYKKTSFHGYKTLEATFSSGSVSGAHFEIGIASTKSSTALNVTKKTVAGSTGGIKVRCDISGVEEGYAGVRFYTDADKGPREVKVTDWKLY